MRPPAPVSSGVNQFTSILNGEGTVTVKLSGGVGSLTAVFCSYKRSLAAPSFILCEDPKMIRFAHWYFVQESVLIYLMW